MRDADLYDPSSNFVGAGGIDAGEALLQASSLVMMEATYLKIIKAQIRCRLTRARNTGSPNRFVIHPLEGSLVRDSMHHC